MVFVLLFVAWGLVALAGGIAAVYGGSGFLGEALRRIPRPGRVRDESER